MPKAEHDMDANLAAPDEYTPIPQITEEERRKASVAVCALAQDLAEAREVLEMLGLRGER